MKSVPNLVIVSAIVALGASSLSAVAPSGMNASAPSQAPATTASAEALGHHTALTKDDHRTDSLDAIRFFATHPNPQLAMLGLQSQYGDVRIATARLLRGQLRTGDPGEYRLVATLIVNELGRQKRQATTSAGVGDQIGPLIFKKELSSILTDAVKAWSARDVPEDVRTWDRVIRSLESDPDMDVITQLVEKESAGTEKDELVAGFLYPKGDEWKAALTKLEEQKAAMAIVRGLTHRRLDVRAAAADALARLRQPQTVTALVDALRRHNLIPEGSIDEAKGYRSIRQAIVEALRLITGQPLYVGDYDSVPEIGRVIDDVEKWRGDRVAPRVSQ